MIEDTGRQDMLLTLLRESLPQNPKPTTEYVRGYIHALFEGSLKKTHDYCNTRRERYEGVHFEGFIDGIEAGLKIAIALERKEIK